MPASFKDRVRAGFEGQGFMTFLGANLAEIEPGECRISLPYSEQVTQQHGFFHGGVMATLADNAAGFAGYSLMSEDEQPLSVEFKISFLAPAKGHSLEARARVVKNGRRLKFAHVEVYALQEDDEKLVAIALATIAVSHTVVEKKDGSDI